MKAALLGLAIVMAAGPAAAVSSYEWTSRAGVEDADMAEAERLLDQGRLEVALPLLRAASQRRPDNADVHNLMGYTLRKLGRLDEAHASYETALRLDPGHRGAHEYLGELLLMRGETARARALLDALARLCPDGCEERTELEDAIRAAGG